MPALMQRLRGRYIDDQADYRGQRIKQLPVTRNQICNH
jgi:hypothetical protein